MNKKNSKNWVSYKKVEQPPRYINALSEMIRWEEFETPMIHKTSLYVHRERVKAIARLIVYFVTAKPCAKELLEIEYLANHHDDHEIIDTDKPSPVKEGMSSEEKEKEARQEIASFEKVGKNYLMLSEKELTNYVKAMRAYQQKKSLASQIVDVADKLDGLGEALHEIRCANIGFVGSYEFYRRRKLKNFETYSFWAKLKQHPAIGFDPMPTIDDLIQIPHLKVDDLTSRKNLKKDIFDPHLPSWYKSWLLVSYDLFKDEPQPEFHLFPGWKTILRRRWNKLQKWS